MAGSMSAWVGCLGCYNEGRLVGEWVEGEDAATFVPCRRPDHEEWWVFDHELPRTILSGECSPAQFSELCEALAGLPAGVDLAVAGAVAEMLGFSGDPDALASMAAEWSSLVEGPYEDLTDAAYDYVESIGGPEHLPSEVLACYFDFTAFGRDLGLGSSGVVRLPDGQLLLLR